MCCNHGWQPNIVRWNFSVLLPKIHVCRRRFWCRSLINISNIYVVFRLEPIKIYQILKLLFEKIEQCPVILFSFKNIPRTFLQKFTVLISLAENAAKTTCTPVPLVVFECKVQDPRNLEFLSCFGRKGWEIHRKWMSFDYHHLRVSSKLRFLTCCSLIYRSETLLGKLLADFPVAANG